MIFRFYALFLVIIGYVSFFINTTAFSSHPSSQKLPLSFHQKKSPKKLITILSIDGGGIRGIIPAIILQEIEKRLHGKKHLSDCFDVMAGTSTGGIIVLLLNTPDRSFKPKYRAADIVDLYKTFGKTLFSRSWARWLWTLDGLLGEKYDAKPLEDTFERYFGPVLLSQSLTHVVIPAYDISLDDTIFFKSSLAKQTKQEDFYLKNVARATSAAPTYFKPARFQDLGGAQDYTLIDGGVSLNNPTLSAAVYASKIFGQETDFLVVSLGTGTNYGVPPGRVSFTDQAVTTGGLLNWATNIIPVMMYAANDVVDDQVSQVFSGSTHHYYRFQPWLQTHDTAMDATSLDALKRLEDYAHDLIRQKDQEINQIVSLLNDKDKS